MDDTSPNLKKLVREQLLARSATERVQMGSRMFDAARAMVLASFPPDLPEIEKKVRLCERLYGDEVDIDGFGSLSHKTRESRLTTAQYGSWGG